MKTLVDPDRALVNGLAAIRREFQVPASFPPTVLAAAEVAVRRPPIEHVDRLDVPFVTLDPATSTDLDQAFWIEPRGGDLLLRYAIADVAWFVTPGDAIDAEAWQRGETMYLPDGKAGLYPPIIGERAASLLPGDPRPAVVFVVRVAPDGAAALDGVERAIIRSRAKLAYATVQPGDLPPAFEELARRIAAAEARRGASRVDPPEQQVAADADGGFTLSFRPRLESEDRNAALSLATNLAVADLLLAHRTGLFRTMPEPDAGAVIRLRAIAAATGVDWPADLPLRAFERRLSPANAPDAAMMTAIRRAGSGASYTPFRTGETPWHAAMGATYAHATAPLRRLADRYVVMAALALANGRPVPEPIAAAFETLPPVMARAGARQGQIDRAVLDLAEAAMLRSRIGETFRAAVIDADRGRARIQLCDLPVLARVAADGAAAGDRIMVRLTQADPETRRIDFERAPHA
ncbi:RNB domain-containing ribonuclease [Sphingomonas sp. NBWT7]|uniref:RNB domain-containing ribonuclease n=1 Tax=Sphingomonas sp. NBWT7 TaxID=2596913 RepID=UPI0016238702|nr:RNB domain-containing ribonuclease [Sphingomonas sp. NBWT7]QNE32348.1 RNB domain-containing ribonuclease [Sphingomonas sp. NBWT7]